MANSFAILKPVNYSLICSVKSNLKLKQHLQIFNIFNNYEKHYSFSYHYCTYSQLQIL